MLLVAAALRIYEALARPTYVDEALSAYLAQLPHADMLRYLYSFDVHPPGFPVFLNALYSLHLPDAAVRLMMAVLGTISVALLMRILVVWRRDELEVLIAGVCAALMPSLIFYDGMVRMYAPFDAIVLCSYLLVSVLATRDDLSPWRRRALWIAWTACLAASIWLLYLGFFMIAAQLAYFAIARRDFLARGLAGAAVAVALWIPQWPTFVHQMPQGGLAFAQLLADVPSAVGRLSAQFTVAPFAQGTQLEVLAALAWAALATAIIATVRCAPKTLLPWLGMPAALTLGYSLVAHKALYIDRYYLIAAYAACAWAGVSIAVAIRRWPRVAGPVAALACAALFAQAVVYAVDPANYTADWPAVEARIFKGPPAVYVFDRGTPVRVLNHDGALSGKVFTGILSPDEAGETVKSLRRYPRVWYVEYQRYQVDPDARVIRYLVANYHAGGQWVFPRDVPGETVTVGYFYR
ncbi:MAG TPA: hypothetical protein VJN22_03270 [Candidatus Eremiobacteraceae bacterium]|nr:hypothetical protein [Candidatus Eremiobacteraceae bacterium]